MISYTNLVLEQLRARDPVLLAEIEKEVMQAVAAMASLDGASKQEVAGIPSNEPEALVIISGYQCDGLYNGQDPSKSYSAAMESFPENVIPFTNQWIFKNGQGFSLQGGSIIAISCVELWSRWKTNHHTMRLGIEDRRFGRRLSLPFGPAELYSREGGWSGKRYEFGKAIVVDGTNVYLEVFM